MPGNGRMFISHTHTDNERCVPLLAALDAWDADYWFDTQRMDAGTELTDAIQRAITERDIFIRACTAETAGSYWMNKERDAFMGLQAAEYHQGQRDKRTLPSLREDMRKHNSQNVFEEMRRYYAALPPEVITKLRLDGLREFRTLENDHPTLPDRLRAAALANFAAPADVPVRPAVGVITPVSAPDAAEVERQLTATLFEPKKGKRSRR